jgi:hypothetical protein
MSSLKRKFFFNFVKYGVFISEGDVAPTLNVCYVYVVHIHKYIHASPKQEVCYVFP